MTESRRPVHVIGLMKRSLIAGVHEVAYSDLTAESIHGTHILSPRALDELYGTGR